MTVQSFIIYPFIISLEFCLESIPTWQNPPLSYAFQKLDTTISSSGTVLTHQEFGKTGELYFQQFHLKISPGYWNAIHPQQKVWTHYDQKALVSDLFTHLTSLIPLTKVCCYLCRSSYHSLLRKQKLMRNLVFFLHCNPCRHAKKWSSISAFAPRVQKLSCNKLSR